MLPPSDARTYHPISPDAAVDSFGSHSTDGLAAEDVANRYGTYGRNQLPTKPGKPTWQRFLIQFNQPLLYILLIAGGVKAFLGSWTNAAVIWGVTVINAVIGFVQEAKAEGAIASLAKAVMTETTVVREGQRLQIPSYDLVPGDIVLLSSGDKVPADLRLLRVYQLQVDESALTGESVPVEKQVAALPETTPLAERTNMAYAGSFVTFGQGTGLVVATAEATEIGQISRSMEQRVNLSTPLTRKFAAFSRLLLYGILTLATLTFGVGLAQGESWIYMFEAAVALAVSAIPEGLPAVVTVTLAIGVNRMARRNAIIRKLPAVEALGSATVICSDKTGTLTENQMTVQAIYAGSQQFLVNGSGYGPQGEIRLTDSEDTKNALTDSLPPALETCLIIGLLCNDSQLKQVGEHWSVMGDPTEGALITAASKADLNQAHCLAASPRLDSIPFESQYQYMATLHQGQPHRICVKGSVEALLSRCAQMLDANGRLVPIERPQVEQAVANMTEQGLRVLAFAEKTTGTHQHSLTHTDLDSGLAFVGLQGMIDPPRPEAIQAVHVCQQAGIRVKMITGDHIKTAQAIAQRMGIGKTSQVRAFEGRQLAEMDDQKLVQVVRDGDVFARVAPTQKLRLVEAIQSNGEIVAMTGDGVNDAPALKQADIGIAMGKGGTEVAREAADMVLTDDNFASIEAAVEEGRTVYQNLRKAIAFLLPVNGGESMTILISALLARDLPILSLQVLWLNLINSLTMTVPLAFEPREKGLMAKPPRPPREPLISGQLLRRIGIVSLFNWILIFGVFEWIKASTGDLTLARTMAIQSLVAARIIYLLSISQLGTNILNALRYRHTMEVNAPILLSGIGAAVVLQLLLSQWDVMNILFETSPLSWSQWGLCLLPMIPMIPVSLAINSMENSQGRSGPGIRS